MTDAPCYICGHGHAEHALTCDCSETHIAVCTDCVKKGWGTLCPFCARQSLWSAVSGAEYIREEATSEEEEDTWEDAVRDNGVEPSQQDTRKDGGNAPKPPKGPTEAIWCKDCDMWLNGQTQWEDHKIGKKHLKNLKKAQGNAATKVGCELKMPDPRTRTACHLSRCGMPRRGNGGGTGDIRPKAISTSSRKRQMMNGWRHKGTKWY